MRKKNYLRLRSKVTEVDAGTVILLFDAWHVKTAKRSCLFNSEIFNSFRTRLSPGIKE